MTAQHTPGPWEARNDHPTSACLHVTDSRGGDVATVFFAPEEDPDSRYLPVRAANARLIAAAPDLLAACRAVESAQRGGDYGAAFDAVRAAIAKATEAV